MKTTLPIILGSSSKWRQLVLNNSGIPFSVMSADIDEKAIRHLDPSIMTVQIAKAKAKALLPKITEPSLLVTADQVVLYKGEIREKPVDEKQAWKFLASYNRFPLQVISAVIATNTETGKMAQGVERAKMIYKKVPLAIFEKMLTLGDGEALSRAGGFILHDTNIIGYVEILAGTMECLDGMPLGLLEKLIKKVS